MNNAYEVTKAHILKVATIQTVGAVSVALVSYLTYTFFSSVDWVYEAVPFFGFGAVFYLILPMTEFTKNLLKSDKRLNAIQRQSPEKIVWIYREERRGRRSGFLGIGATKTINLGLSNKRIYRIPDIFDSEQVWQALIEEFPEVTFGYSIEISNAFATNPLSLLRSENETE